MTTAALRTALFLAMLLANLVSPEPGDSARQCRECPFGGVPIGVKELDEVAGWPDTHACAVFADRVAAHTSVSVERLRDRALAPPAIDRMQPAGGERDGEEQQR